MALGKVVEVLLLVLVANGAPILASRYFPRWLDYRIDGGLLLADGRPLLGATKTWRGLLVSLAATALAAMLLGYGWRTGLVAAGAAMAGDLLSSFVKRRLGIPSSGMAPVLDQLPEALLPALALIGYMELNWLEAVVGALLFCALELPISRLLYRLGVRDRPY